jgi:hypothetical protein
VETVRVLPLLTDVIRTVPCAIGSDCASMTLPETEA